VKTGTDATAAEVTMALAANAANTAKIPFILALIAFPTCPEEA
jgi:hypothetical protein